MTARLTKASKHIYLPIAGEGEEETPYDGMTKTLSEWARVSHKSKQLIAARIKHGYSVREAIFAPTRAYSSTKRKAKDGSVAGHQ